MVIIDLWPNIQKTHLNVQVLQVFIVIWQKEISLNKRLQPW
jgi:hypothetical protein